MTQDELFPRCVASHTPIPRGWIDRRHSERPEFLRHHGAWGNCEIPVNLCNIWGLNDAVLTIMVNHVHVRTA